MNKKISQCIVSIIGAGFIAVTMGCGSNQPNTISVYGELAVENEPGRSGAYYLPNGYQNTPLPIVVYYHGTNGNGAAVVEDNHAFANEYNFILIAPDSRTSPNGQFSWFVGTPAQPGQDYAHIQAAIAEVLSFPGVQATDGGWLAAGHSGGASSGPFLATNDDRFGAFASLHGGVLTGSIGPQRIPGWFSTGEADTLRTPTGVLADWHDLSVGLGFDDVRFVVYPGGHQVSSGEADDLYNWWQRDTM